MVTFIDGAKIKLEIAMGLHAQTSSPNDTPRVMEFMQGRNQTSSMTRPMKTISVRLR